MDGLAEERYAAGFKGAVPAVPSSSCCGRGGGCCGRRENIPGEIAAAFGFLKVDVFVRSPRDGHFSHNPRTNFKSISAHNYDLDRSNAPVYN
jgi:hypothetical protein